MKTTATILLYVTLIAAPSTIMAQQPPAVPVVSTFDGGLDGWTPSEHTFSDIFYHTSGGNPDGYLRHNDDTDDYASVDAPPKFLGNWTSLDDTGLLSFDHHVILPGNERGDYHVWIEGPGGRAQWHQPIGPDHSTWITLLVPVKEGNWIIESGDWLSILSNVTKLKIGLESYTSTDHNGLDNVTLFRAVSSCNPPDLELSMKPVLTFATEIDAVYVIETSTDMLSWVTLATKAGTGGLIHYTDMRDNAERNFYRARVICDPSP